MKTVEEKIAELKDVIFGANIDPERLAEILLELKNGNSQSNGNSYSIDEKLTGGTWIDGKPIYRKVLTGTTNNSSELNEVDVSSLNIDLLLSNSNILIIEDTQLNYVLNTELSYDNNAIHFETIYTGLNYNFILEYTKTTD
jgi:hypothetical protein